MNRKIIDNLVDIFPNVILVCVVILVIGITTVLATEFLDERKVISECIKLGGPDAICYNYYTRGDFIEEYYSPKSDSEK